MNRSFKLNQYIVIIDMCSVVVFFISTASKWVSSTIYIYIKKRFMGLSQAGQRAWWCKLRWQRREILQTHWTKDKAAVRELPCMAKR